MHCASSCATVISFNPSKYFEKYVIPPCFTGGNGGSETGNDLCKVTQLANLLWDLRSGVLNSKVCPALLSTDTQFSQS